MSRLIPNKQYIAKVVSYDEILGRGMLELSETYDRKHVPFRGSEVRMNLTEPGNFDYEADQLVVFRFNLDLRFEATEKPAYLGGCV